MTAAKTLIVSKRSNCTIGFKLEVSRLTMTSTVYTLDIKSRSDAREIQLALQAMLLGSNIHKHQVIDLLESFSLVLGSVDIKHVEEGVGTESSWGVPHFHFCWCFQGF